MNPRELAARLERRLRGVIVYGWRMRLEGLTFRPRVTTLRSALGDALSVVNRPIYDEYFHPPENGPAPRYLLRDLGWTEGDPKVYDLLLFGPLGQCIIDAFWLAWDLLAGGRKVMDPKTGSIKSFGLGHNREVFTYVKRSIGRDGKPLATSEVTGVPLHQLLQFAGRENQSCRLTFKPMVRLLRDKRLIERPTLRDVTVAAVRRVEGFTREIHGSMESEEKAGWLCAADAVTASPWEGARVMLPYHSSRQDDDVDLRGVAGSFHLPGGVGELAPLFSTVPWLHIGKGTVFGLGGMEVEWG